MKRRRKTRILLLLLAAHTAVMVSCSGDRSSALTGESGEYQIDRTFTRGPVEFRVAVSKKEITIAERLDLLVVAKAEEGYVAELPAFGDKLEQFGIVDYNTPPPSLAGDGSVVTSRSYVLEPFLSGEYRIPPMTVRFREEGDSTATWSVESDTLKVTVLSILPEDMGELEMKDIAGPRSIPSGRRWLYISAGLVLAAAVAALLYVRHRKRRPQSVRTVPAHEVAFDRLERLLAEGLIDDKLYAEFTARVSDILRQYIEDRFGLRAPERTTEEFLAEAGPGLEVEQDRKKILKDFLVHCDLVKFAAFEPTAEDVKRTFDTCRDFIEATKREEEVSGEAA